MSRKRLLALAAFLASLPLLSRAGDWVQFRGPNNSGLVADSQVPGEWGADKNLAWKIKIPGYGWSSPIIVGDKIIVTTAVSDKQKAPQPMRFGGGYGPPGGKGGPKGGFPKGDFSKGPPGGFGKGGPGGFGNANPPNDVYRWEIHCLDRTTGKTLWSEVALERKPTIAGQMGNTFASETPVSDGERVYVYFGMHGLFCYDLTGKQLWKKDLGSYKMMMGWGTGSSPALEGDRLFVLCDNEEKSFLAAFDKKSGQELWRKERDEKSNWTTPFVWRNKVRTEIVTAGGKAVRSYDPADGNVLWELSAGGAAPAGGGGRMGPMSPSTNATPVANEEMIFVGRGNPFGGSPLWAVKAGAKGDISLKAGQTSSDSIAWYNPKAGPPMASPLLYKDYLYILAQNGNQLYCYDAKTGKEVYTHRLDGASGFTSSPWASDGKIYCLDQDGQAYVVQAGPEFKLLAKNELKDMFWATPAVASGALYLRGRDQLYCVKQ
jgi:outer membrane protein assembly factor BamB